MPVTGTQKVLAASLFSMIQAELAGAGQPLPTSAQSLQALCNGIANAIVPHLLLITVNPGIPTAGSPAAQVSVGPGTVS